MKKAQGGEERTVADAGERSADERSADERSADEGESGMLAEESIDRLREMGEMLGPEVPQKIIELYLTDAASRLAELGRAVAAADGQALTETAHSLKGSSANLGATGLAELCHELEERAPDVPPAEAESVLGLMAAEFRAVEKEMRRLLVELG